MAVPLSVRGAPLLQERREGQLQVFSVASEKGRDSHAEPWNIALPAPPP